MPRIVSQRISAARPDAEENYEGGVSFIDSPKRELLRLATTWLVGQPKFYAGGMDELKRARGLIEELVVAGEVDWLLRLCEYIRTKMYLRDAAIVLLVETARACMASRRLTEEIKVGIGAAIPNVCSRGDQVADFLSYWALATGQTAAGSALQVPHFIRRGLNCRIAKLTQYEVNKYGQRRGAVTLRDALRLCHPKPADSQQDALYRWIVHGLEASECLESLPEVALRQRFLTLEPGEFAEAEAIMNSAEGRLTWEDIVQVLGSSTEVWALAAQHMPYMATIRNLRNLLGFKVKFDGFYGYKGDRLDFESIRQPVEMSIVESVAQRIENEEAVRKSKVFPFRLLAAYLIIEEMSTATAGRLREALSRAMNYSVQNVPRLPGTTFLAADVSGSMCDPVSEKSAMRLIDIGAFMVSLARDFCDTAWTGVFASEFAMVSVDRSQSVIERYRRLVAEPVGEATYGYKVIGHLLDEDIQVDRIVLFTDEEMYTEYWGLRNEDFIDYWQHYSRKYPGCHLYVVDLAGYQHCVTPENDPNVSVIGGWSERIFDYIRANESIAQIEL